MAVLCEEHGQFALYLVSIKSGERKLLLDVHHPLWDVRWSPDGRWIAAEAEMQASDRALFVVEVDTGISQLVKEGSLVLNAQHPAWSPDSNFLAFSAQTRDWYDIGLYELQTGRIIWLMPAPGDDTSPCWSPDGERICWLHTEGAVNSLRVYERDGGMKQVVVSAGVHHQPQFTRAGEILIIIVTSILVLLQ